VPAPFRNLGHRAIRISIRNPPLSTAEKSTSKILVKLLSNVYEQFDINNTYRITNTYEYLYLCANLQHVDFCRPPPDGANSSSFVRSEPVALGSLPARCESFRSLTSYGSFRSCHTYKVIFSTVCLYLCTKELAKLSGLILEAAAYLFQKCGQKEHYQVVATPNSRRPQL
jgi:hypothetical protein